MVPDAVALRVSLQTHYREVKFLAEHFRFRIQLDCAQQILAPEIPQSCDVRAFLKDLRGDGHRGRIKVTQLFCFEDPGHAGSIGDNMLLLLPFFGCCLLLGSANFDATVLKFNDNN